MYAVAALSLLYVIIQWSIYGGLVPPPLHAASSALLIFTCLYAAARRVGARSLLALSLASAVGFSVEAIGVNTGIPFGNYSYGDMLRPKVLGVPLVIPLLWFAVTYAAYLAALAVARGALVLPLAVTNAVLWNMSADPTLSQVGLWTWENGGFYGVPYTNFLGWTLTALLISSIYRRLDRGPATPWHALPYVALSIAYVPPSISMGLHVPAAIGVALAAFYVAAPALARRAPTRL